MTCPNCGQESRANFCPNCGTALAASEPRIQQTSHFRIHVLPRSFGEQNSTMIATRLESAYAAMTGILGIEVHGAVIDVHLSELMVEYGGQRLAGGGYAVPRRMQIHDVYLPDAPGESLERSLLVLLLALALGNDREPPAFVVDGLLARAMQTLNPYPEQSAIVSQLVDARNRNELPALAGLFEGPSPATRGIYDAAASSFMGFLLESYGIDPIKNFTNHLIQGEGPDAAARNAFRTDLVHLEKDWLKSLKAAKPGGMWRFLKQSWSYLKTQKLRVAEIVVYISMSVAFTIGMAKVQGVLISKALLPHDGHALAVIMGSLAAAFVVTSLASLRQSYVTAQVAESVLRRMRLSMFRKLQYLQPGYFQTVRTGDIMSRLTSDVAAIQFALTGSMAQGFRMMLTLVVAVITIFLTNWKLAAIGMVGMPLFFISTRYLGPAAARASKERQRQMGVTASSVQENLQAQQVVKAFGLQERMITDYENSLISLFKASIRLTFLTGIYSLSASSVATAINLTVMGVGALFVINASGPQSTADAMGTLFTFLALMAQVIGPVQNLSSILQGFQQASGAMDRVEELLTTEPTIRDKEGARPIPPLRQGIFLRNVNFGYTEGQPILRGINLTIPAGSNVALVGPSGCGKSTILNLIMRFYDPVAGEVLYDGVDIREATIESVRGQMGVVFQDNILFNTTIRENLRMGNLQATDAQVEAAARAAEIHDLIMSLPEGYETIVGERGSRLSGGQRQRMAIARAIVRDPAILVLDEATSALDPRTEAAINETLSRIGRGRTTIAVTHRLASVVGCDQIFVLDRGQLVEQGTHEELLQRNGLYANLWREQGGGIGDTGPHAPAPGQPARLGNIEAAHLRQVPIFAQLDPRLLSTLAEHLTREAFPPGAEIVRQGDMGDKLYVIGRGQVDVCAADGGGRERPLAVLREGDYFGEVALLRDVPRTATVRARTPVEVYSLSKLDFGHLLAAVPPLRQAMERTMAQRNQIARGAVAVPTAQ